MPLWAARVRVRVKAGATNSYRRSDFSGVLEHTVVPYPHEHQLNMVVLQKVVCYYKNGKKKAIKMEERQTIITFTDVGLSYREIVNKVRPKETTEFEDKFL